MTPLSRPAAQLLPTPEMPSPTGEILCLECAARGTSCCLTDPDLTHLSFPISPAEWRRLLPWADLATTAPLADAAAFAREEAALGPGQTPDQERNQAPGRTQGRAQGRGADQEAAAPGPPPLGDALCAAEPNTPEFISSMRALFPREKSRIMSLFPEDERHLTMKTRNDGSCVFLGSAGCRLPRAVRPWYCLLFPAWVTGGALTLFLSEDCLISQRARGPAHGIELLGLTPARVRAMHQALCQDWDLGR